MRDIARCPHGGRFGESGRRAPPVKTRSAGRRPVDGLHRELNFPGSVGLGHEGAEGDVLDAGIGTIEDRVIERV
jgi:hypothetical protein